MMRVVDGWIVEEVNGCTCSGGFAAVGYAHERGCGLEPIERVKPLKAVVHHYPSSWSGYPHSWQWIIPNPLGREQDAFDFGWEDTFERAIEEAHVALRLMGELFAAYAAMEVA